MTSSRHVGELYVVMTLLSTLSVVGSAGNALVLYVFSTKKDMLVSTRCIIALATVDFITCLVVMPFTVYMEYVDFHVGSDFVCKLYQFLITSNIPFSALIMVAIALDRYLCICHPFAQVIKGEGAKAMICVLWLMAAALGAVVSLMFGVYQRCGIVHGDQTFPANDTTISTVAGDQGDAASVVAQCVISSASSNLTFELDRTAATSTGPRENDATVENYREITSATAFFETTDAFLTGSEESVVVNVGLCQQNDLLLNDDFQFFYQKLYNAIFPLCLAVVVVLYVLIYRSVLERRSRRQKQKSKSLVHNTLVVNTEVQLRDGYGGTGTTTMTLIPTAAVDGNDSSTSAASDTPLRRVATAAAKSTAVVEKRGELVCNDGERRPSNWIDSNRMANLKTAAMLFVVNVVFVVTFMPAFLIANKLVPYNMVVFYLYFANNVANPVIYSFMNKNFRADLVKLFK